MHKHHPFLCLNPSHTRIKPAQTSPTVRLSPYHACIQPAQTSPTSTSESFSYKHQTCTNHNHPCVLILLMLASNLRKHHQLLRLNPYRASICNIRPNITQRRSVEKVPINDWQASVTLILLVFHRLDLAS